MDVFYACLQKFQTRSMDLEVEMSTTLGEVASSSGAKLTRICYLWLLSLPAFWILSLNCVALLLLLLLLLPYLSLPL